MCFVNDGDWTARVYEVTQKTSERKRRCQECDQMIQAGIPFWNIWMQEYEECHTCTMGKCDCVQEDNNDLCCKCTEPDHGEEFETWHCQECHKFLEAIREAEIESGCSPYEAQPLCEQMVEAISNTDESDAERYFIKAAVKYPELGDSGYLKRLHEKCFPEKKFPDLEQGEN